MAEIVNLRRARKAAARQVQDAEAAERRARHGRSKAERQRAAAEQALQQRIVDSARRDGRPPESD